MNIRALFTAALSVYTISFPAFSETVVSCRAIEKDLDRLACYDRVSGRTPKTTSAKNNGSWSVSIRKSELKDTTDVYLHVNSNEMVSCRFGNRDKVTLWVRCQENTTSVIFSTPNCHMTSSDYNDYGDVEYRIDTRKSKTAHMEESTNNHSLGLWSGRKAIPFAKEMFGASKLIARMTPYNENPFTVTFDISGLEEAIEPLRKSCRW